MKDYYIGLDIGTDSVGYAVTDENYKLFRFKGESMWGSALFDAAEGGENRRAFRTARRRLDRKQLRIRLLQEFFAGAITTVDSNFFIRLRESSLYAEDRTDKDDAQTLFNDATFKDVNFHNKYPTIHHLIMELILNKAPHDPRLVYIACAWLMTHRGHFLSEIKLENVTSLDDVTIPYQDLMDYMSAIDEENEVEYEPMWTCNATEFGDILSKKLNISTKREILSQKLFGADYAAAWKSTETRFNRKDVISLLCGGEASAISLFRKDEYEEIAKISLTKEDAEIEAIVSQLGEDGDLIIKLKALFDWAILRDVKKGSVYISEAKVKIYEQHKQDLKTLKSFLNKQGKKIKDKILNPSNDDKLSNYSAYVKKGKGTKKVSKENFSEWLKKEISGIKPAPEDEAFYNDMMSRLETQTFLPKQVDGDNRVIPHQLYQVELRAILENASHYLPFLNESDVYGTVASKIEKIFAFRIPYYVGPLVNYTDERGKFAWMKRKAEGIIRPWNFDTLVDLDASEEEFIQRMTCNCTYLPEEKVLPENSLLYKEFTLLNELNPLKINGARIPAEAKTRIVNELFKQKKKVTRKALEKFLLRERLMEDGDLLSGIDEELKSTLSSYHDFKGWLNQGKLCEEDVEEIILRASCTSDKHRLEKWLSEKYSAKLNSYDIKKISNLKYTGFGKLSKKFLTGIKFIDYETREENSVIGFMRSKNVLLMECLSQTYSLSEKLKEVSSIHHPSMEEWLESMYVSSAVKRQIYRALDIVKTIIKIQGHPPKRIFVEMARGGTPDQKGKRTISRYDQLTTLFKQKNSIAREVATELKNMGENAHNKLQSDAIYLWMLQLGKCAYCGKSLSLHTLKSEANIDHIHPQSLVKDDSVMNNKVLCCSKCNSDKKDIYPIPENMRQVSLWDKWHDNNLINDEKYARLKRTAQLSDADLQGFINRQLVETRQTTKAIFTILKTLLPEAEIISVKAGNVSDFRHLFKMVKSRTINDLHHAKDAYLNIAVGNVYYEKFTKRIYRQGEYSMKPSTIFGPDSHIKSETGFAWNGQETINRIIATMSRNDIHLTKYAYLAKGGFFDQMLVTSKANLIPQKAERDTSKYGGYNKPTSMGFLLVKYLIEKKKSEVAILPINLLDKTIILTASEEDVCTLITQYLSSFESKTISNISFPMGRKILKINTVLSLDGFPYILTGKQNNGKVAILRSLQSLILSGEMEAYVKRIESVLEKTKKNPSLLISPLYDKITEEENVKLFEHLIHILDSKKFRDILAPSAIKQIKDGFPSFQKFTPKHLIKGDISEMNTISPEKELHLKLLGQITSLINIISLLKTNRATDCNLSNIGGKKSAGMLTISTKMSNWKKHFKDARFIFVDFSGLHRTTSQNLLELL